jgi:transcriptional regulator with XRE-family HTH domain
MEDFTMNIAIGEIISKIRKEKTLTQEQLSEVFGVSVAAVSKWETGIAYPDIELLPKIADFFDISVDRLLGYDMNKTKMSIDEHLKKADDLFFEERKEKEAIAYLGNLAYKYPNNVKILVKYAQTKFYAVHGTPRNENHRKLFKEAEDILLSINTNGLSRHEYDSVMNVLYLLYLWDKKFDKAEKILNELKPDGPDFWFYVHKGDFEKAKEKYYSLLEKTFSDNSPLTYGHYHAFYDEPEKVIELNNKFIKMIQIFAEDLPDNDRISIHYEGNAHMYAIMGNSEQSLYNFEKAVENAIEYHEKIKPRGEKYTPFKWALNSDERKEYDLIRNTEKFKELLKKIEEYGL